MKGREAIAASFSIQQLPLLLGGVWEQTVAGYPLAEAGLRTQPSPRDCMTWEVGLESLPWLCKPRTHTSATGCVSSVSVGHLSRGRSHCWGGSAFSSCELYWCVYAGAGPGQGLSCPTAPTTGPGARLPYS